MPLHKRRAVFVKIDSGRCNGIFRVGAVREFTAALKNLTSTMYLHHCLQQQLDNFWVEIAANQRIGVGSRRSPPRNCPAAVADNGGGTWWTSDFSAQR